MSEKLNIIHSWYTSGKGYLECYRGGDYYSSGPKFKVCITVEEGSLHIPVVEGDVILNWNNPGRIEIRLYKLENMAALVKELTGKTLVNHEETMVSDEWETGEPSCFVSTFTWK